MSDPTSAAAAGGYATYKLAIALGLPAGLAAVLVMLWVQPKSPREWAMALISTVAGSLCGGAWVIRHFEWQHLAVSGELVDLMAFGGIFFACGLPGWVIVRAAFAWIDKRKDRDLAELAREVRSEIGK